jgi:hypothetical protein
MPIAISNPGPSALLETLFHGILQASTTEVGRLTIVSAGQRFAAIGERGRKTGMTCLSKEQPMPWTDRCPRLYDPI